MGTSISINTGIATVQQPKLSPAQIQAMRLLEIPACELQARINEELQNNPALDEGPEVKEEADSNEYDNPDGEYDNPLQNEDFNYNDYIEDDDPREYSSNTSNRPNEEIPFSMGTSFAEYLKSQVYLTKMDKADRHIAKFVVGNIDDRGYLTRTVEELVDDLSFREGLIVTDAKMQEIVDQIKDFDPVGVGAYNLQECFLIQLRKKKITPSTERAIAILTHYYDAFCNQQFSKIYHKLGITEEQFKEAYEEIKHLNPNPGNSWVGTVLDRNQTIIIPDFIVEQVENDLTISLNNGSISELRISEEYQNMLTEYSQPTHNNAKIKEAAKFVKTSVDNAKYFIDAIRQRNETMLRSMEVLVVLQRDFFLHGDSMYLRPLTQKDIAERTGYDISTISRTFSNKYVQTEFGIFPLKYFFSDKIANSQGDQIATREIKEVLREVIEQEDKTHPITDDQLKEKMNELGYPIQRRTVAKYRENMGIPVARKRRKIF